MGAILAAILLAAVPGGSVRSGGCEPAAYEVMSLLIRERFGEDFSLIVISSETEPMGGGIDYSIDRKAWPGLKDETIDSLIVMNRGRTERLEARFDLPVEYRLISEREYFLALQDSLRGDGECGLSASGHLVPGGEGEPAEGDTIHPDWDRFDRLFPDAQGCLKFSRVAFDPDCSQALLIYSNSYRCSGDRVRPQRRKTAFFMRRKGDWELVGVLR